MGTTIENQLVALFPRLQCGQFAVTSPKDPKYNCIAWAAGDAARWWEPDPMGTAYWPPGVAREYTVDAYAKAYEELGFTACAKPDYEDGVLKLALFARGSEPRHAARQVGPKTWTSKLGRSVDIEHALEDVSGDVYGEVVRVLCRH